MGRQYICKEEFLTAEKFYSSGIFIGKKKATPALKIAHVIMCYN